MKTNDFTDNSVQKKYFRHIVSVAKADGVIDEKERKTLHRMGYQFGLFENEIDQLLDSDTKPGIDMPLELKDRFSIFYLLFKTALSDGNFQDKEKKIIKYLCVASGMSENDIKILFEVLENGIKEGIDEEDLLSSFLKKRKNNK